MPASASMRPSWPPPSTATSSLDESVSAIRTCLAHRLGRPPWWGPRGACSCSPPSWRWWRGAGCPICGSRGRRRCSWSSPDWSGSTRSATRSIGSRPTLAFLAAVFVLAEVARDAGLFSAAGAWMGARRARRGVSCWSCRRSRSLVTVLMSLDATAVLFTPVVVAAGAGPADAARMRRCSRPRSSRTRRRACCRCRTSPTCSCSRPRVSPSVASRCGWPSRRWRRRRWSSAPRCGATATTDRRRPTARRVPVRLDALRLVRRRRPRGAAGRVLRRVRARRRAGLDRARRRRRRRRSRRSERAGPARPAS